METNNKTYLDKAMVPPGVNTAIAKNNLPLSETPFKNPDLKKSEDQKLQAHHLPPQRKKTELKDQAPQLVTKSSKESSIGEHRAENPASIMTDIKFANISSTASIASFFTALWELFNPDPNYSIRSHPITDLVGKIRNLAQYSIHAKPSSKDIAADDIRGDSSHNLAAVWLGIKSYQHFAFVSPILYVLKNMAALSKNSTVNFLSRCMSAYDEVIMPRVVNIYWNIRRVSKGVIKYLEKRITSSEVEEHSSKVKDAFTMFGLSRLAKLPAWMLQPLSFLGLDKPSVLKRKKEIAGEPKELLEEVFKGWFHNLSVFKKGEYTDPETGKVHKVGDSDPETHGTYARMRVLSQALGPILGGGAAIINSISVVLGSIGRIFQFKGLDDLGFRLANFGFAMQTVMYASNDIPAHLNEFYKDWKRDNLTSGSFHRLGIFLTGALASGLTFVRPFINNTLINKITDPIFRAFFSLARKKLHEDEYKISAKTRLRSQVAKAEKIKEMNPFSIISRVLTHDKDFTYTTSYQPSHEEIEKEEEKVA